MSLILYPAGGGGNEWLNLIQSTDRPAKCAGWEICVGRITAIFKKRRKVESFHIIMKFYFKY